VSAQLPVGEPPADDVAALLDALRWARDELAYAHEVVARLASMAAADEQAGEYAEARWAIEQAVAAKRAELWAPRVAQLVARARALGVDVSLYS
jgi:hypothetical protein